MTTPKVAGTIRSKNPLKGAVAILPERLYYASLKEPPPSHNILASTPRRGPKTPEAPVAKKQIHFFNIDNELVYWNFFLDFGPLNLGQLTRFCNKLNDKLRKFPVVCFYSNCLPAKRANAIFLICAYQLIYLQRTPEQAYRGFDKYLQKSVAEEDGSEPPVSVTQGLPTLDRLPPFHDASPCQCTYDLTVMDCLKGMAKAISLGFYDPQDFDAEEYEHFEQVENGDLNWIVKGKILAFAGPSFERHVSPEGYCTLAPKDYIPYFQQKNVSLVVRLNKRCYNEEDFREAGIDHLDAFFLDGSCPPLKVLYKVLDAFESVPPGQAFAVHCKAGLGRTGTCIGAYLMKHYRFTASEAIAWMRICRPGCVIGPQQHFLQQIQDRMWREGENSQVLSLDRSLAAISTSADDEDDDEIMETTDNEAVEGRTGQAEALLNARNRRAGGIAVAAAVDPHTNMVTPMTPEQTSKSRFNASIVTPDAGKIRRPAASTQLWCG